MRDRLIELIQDSVQGCARHWAEVIADHLLANGVIVPPCKVGDKVYYHGGIYKSLVKSAVVEEIIISSSGVGDLRATSEDGITFVNSIDIFFFTKEEAEQKLKEVKV